MSEVVAVLCACVSLWILSFTVLPTSSHFFWLTYFFWLLVIWWSIVRWKWGLPAITLFTATAEARDAPDKTQEANETWTLFAVSDGLMVTEKCLFLLRFTFRNDITSFLFLCLWSWCFLHALTLNCAKKKLQTRTMVFSSTSVGLDQFTFFCFACVFEQFSCYLGIVLKFFSHWSKSKN